MSSKTCQAEGCTNIGALFPSGRWCHEEHAPYLFAEGRQEARAELAPGRTRYCAPNRCYCGYCPSWRPHPADRPKPPLITAAENQAMVAERARLTAQVDAELGRIRAAVLRERPRR